jgi:hypothetical protein
MGDTTIGRRPVVGSPIVDVFTEIKVLANINTINNKTDIK